ncbi:MAG: rhodanese-like domain-containing protein [Pedobacter sp.]|nr:MAG: rhodanese-like domain-containing protein [Pedobacter sp.]
MRFVLFAIAMLTVFANISVSNAQQLPGSTLQSNPWKSNQLVQPATLMDMMKKDKSLVVYNIGVVQDIKGATHIGAASEKEKLQLLSTELKKLSKDKTVVVYCGCCPFEKCPNIRPAFRMLQANNFSKAYLLNLPTNLKTDWIAKGYPLAN